MLDITFEDFTFDSAMNRIALYIELILSDILIAFMA